MRKRSSQVWTVSEHWSRRLTRAVHGQRAASPGYDDRLTAGLDLCRLTGRSIKIFSHKGITSSKCSSSYPFLSRHHSFKNLLGMDKLLDFDIDKYLNPCIPPNFTSHLPRPISRFLGYRSGQVKEPPSLIVHAWATLGSFLSLLLIGAVFKYAPGITQFNPPILIASLGASAVLEYAAIQTPLAQPRNTIVGQGISASLGVAISKAFQMNPNFGNLQWIAAAISCATAILAMSLTNTVHPPGGASAVLACIEPTVIAMGWWFVPCILVSISLMLGVSLINNNVMRRYPCYWWTSEEVGQRWRCRSAKDEEASSEKDSDVQRYVRVPCAFDWLLILLSETTLHREPSSDHNNSKVFISAYELRLPPHIALRQEEIAMLRELQIRLRK